MHKDGSYDFLFLNEFSISVYVNSFVLFLNAVLNLYSEKFISM